MRASEAIFADIIARRGRKLQYIGTSRRWFPISIRPFRYVPDFLDPKTSEYFEVKGSRSSYESARLILETFRLEYPQISLHVVTPEGLDCGKVWGESRRLWQKRGKVYAGKYYQLESILESLYQIPPKDFTPEIVFETVRRWTPWNIEEKEVAA